MSVLICTNNDSLWPFREECFNFSLLFSLHWFKSHCKVNHSLFWKEDLQHQVSFKFHSYSSSLWGWTANVNMISVCVCVLTVSPVEQLAVSPSVSVSVMQNQTLALSSCNPPTCPHVHQYVICLHPNICPSEVKSICFWQTGTESKTTSKVCVICLAYREGNVCVCVRACAYDCVQERDLS